MNSLKAVFSGSLFIIIASLVLQLVALFIMVAYTHLEQVNPFFKDISGIFRYLIGIPIFILVMFFGGYITAMIAKKGVVLHALVVGFVTAVGMMWLALENAELTTTGIVIFVLMVIGTATGGFHWKRKNNLVGY